MPVYQFQCSRCFIVSGKVSRNREDAPTCCGGKPMIATIIPRRNLTPAGTNRAGIPSLCQDCGKEHVIFFKGEYQARCPRCFLRAMGELLDLDLLRHCTGGREKGGNKGMKELNSKDWVRLSQQGRNDLNAMWKECKEMLSRAESAEAALDQSLNAVALARQRTHEAEARADDAEEWAKAAMQLSVKCTARNAELLAERDRLRAVLEQAREALENAPAMCPVDRFAGLYREWRDTHCEGGRLLALSAIEALDD